MSEIQFPSPTALLGSSHISIHPPHPAPSAATSTGNAKRKSVDFKTQKPKAKAKAKAKAEPGTKPKQSKSRNGCVTCKNKRLKCDETKPTCQQCAKRQVDCGGYIKDWKWKDFNKEMVVNKVPGPARTKKASVSVKHQSEHQTRAPQPARITQSPPASDGSGSTLTPKAFADTPKALRPPSPVCSPDDDSKPPPLLDQASKPEFGAGTSSLSLNTNVQGIAASASGDTGLTPAFHGMVFSPNSGASHPSAIQQSSLHPADILIPSDEQGSPQDDFCDDPANTSLGLNISDVEMDNVDANFDDSEIEEIFRTSPDMTLMRSSSANSFGLPNGSMNFEIPAFFMSQEPRLSPYSPEMLMSQFNRNTCGILSVRDGPNENPWRTLIYPLVKESQALYHAIASMTAFHSSKGRPDMKCLALEHRARSISMLTKGIHQMRSDIAIAITLVLAFAESWDAESCDAGTRGDGRGFVTTGAQHLIGAKSFLDQALTAAQPLETPPLITRRIRFLCNTWVYMDVLARFTSIELDRSEDFDNALWASYNQFGGLHEIDPLMGCASSMFPLIGRVANLVRYLWNLDKNSLRIIAEANELKRLLEEWQPPADLTEPEDEQCDTLAAMRTAEAYRYATLLYLHQAVPEIPSRTAGQLARKALVHLTLVPLSSKTIIVQIYPLLLAGCEASSADDRAWVKSRWRSMSQTMNIANIDRCRDVVREVWHRRDMYEEMMAHRRGMRQQTRSSSEEMFGRTSFSPESDSTAWGLGDTCGDIGDLDPMSSFASNAHCHNQAFMEWSRPLNMHRGRQFTTDIDSLSPAATSGRSRTESMEVREELHPERTVRGRQHWIGVMADWNWEVLLG